VFIKQQYMAINKHFDAQKKIILIAYPPLKYLPDSVRSIRHDLLIADLVDDDAARTLEIKKKEACLSRYQQMLPECRWIFSTSPALNEKYKKYARQDIDFIPNGVDLRAYTVRSAANFRIKSNRKVVGYVGSINKAMDTELFEYALSCCTETDFVLVGFCRKEQQQVIDRFRRSYGNFNYLGVCNYRDIPQYLYSFDVLISFKKADYTTAGGDSMKIYEYLATGSPIVSTPVPPAEQFKDIIYVAYDKVQFTECLKKALEENNSLLREKRKQAARENSWEKRVDVILDKVSGLV
jgi:glycosyltransferase involved in cell wall biosynthesis